MNAKEVKCMGVLEEVGNLIKLLQNLKIRKEVTLL